MLPQTTQATDDNLTLVSISALACIVQDVLHEGLGHGVMAWFSGAHKITISTVAMQSDINTRAISAAGTVVNLIAAAIFWPMLRNKARYRPSTRYFLALALAGNLFTATGYFLFSGVLNFGDWAAVIHGLQPHWAWQLGLIVVGVLSYYASMLLVASEFGPFKTIEGPRRPRLLCWTPYFTDGVLAFIAGLPNPTGLFYIVASALPSTLGANTGLLVLPSMLRSAKPNDEPQGPICRSLAWIVFALVACLLYVVVVGRGVTWSR